MASITSRKVFVAVVLLLLLGTGFGFPKLNGGRKSVNGGTTCMACTIVVTLLQQLMQVHSFTPEESIDYVCSCLPDIFGEACNTVKPILKDFLVNKLNSTDNADVICYSLDLCRQDPGYQYCHLFPLPEEGMEEAIRNSKAHSNYRKLPRAYIDFDICNIEGLEKLCDFFNFVGQDKTAKIDKDHDRYSQEETMRGYDWRGQDCREGNGEAYPGKLPTNWDADYDSNCNGIYGVNPNTGIPFEQELCGDQDNYGIIMIGDSIGAHFHAPPDWLRASVFDAEVWKNLTFIAANELNWPHMSFATGYVNGTWPVVINSTTNSLYWRLRDRNLCVHRDYQNLAFNGAESGTAFAGSVNMTRDEGKDKPVILIYAEFGNDICGADTGSPDEMTPVDKFTEDVLEYLSYLDTRLPYNSHVVMNGLVNGTYLYTILKGRLHPLGELNGDITYDDVYNYFYCMQQVCPGWTNTNRTIQDGATAHAMELSSALEQIAANANYARFDVHYTESPMERAIEEWISSGGEPWQLIEPVDGLHPSKYGQDLFAQVGWELITERFPEILEPINPNNARIRQIFGDQGGH